MITDHYFAGNIVIFEKALEVLVGALDTLSTEFELLGLRVSRIKTKIQRFVIFFAKNIDLQPPAAVQGDRVSFADNLVYFGSALGSGGRSFPGIN